MTVDDINRLISQTPLEGQITATGELDIHELLNKIDSAIGADTEWVSSKECGCLWHIGKACHARRAVGARVRMLEEAVARQTWEADYHRRGLRVSSRGVVTQG